MKWIQWLCLMALGMVVLTGCNKPPQNMPAVENASTEENGGPDAVVQQFRFPSPQLLVNGDLADLFQTVCTAKTAENSSMTVNGLSDWFYLRSELRFCSIDQFWGEVAAEVSMANNPENADPLPAIIDFSSQLRSRGVELWLLPVPAKAVIYPEFLDPSLQVSESERLDRPMVEWINILREAGVEVIDLVETFQQAKSGSTRPVYCMQDSHWSGYACEVAAALLAERLSAMPVLEGAGRRTFSAEPKEVEIHGDLVHAAEDADSSTERLQLRFISLSGEPVGEDRASPVLVMGDSHTLVFHAGGDMHAVGSGLVDQLSYELGIGVDLLGVRGSGATPARISLMRRMRADGDYIKGKRVVIWCFSAREFTEADGWRLVPLP